MGWNVRDDVIDWVKSIIFAVVLIVAVRTFLFTPVVVDGASMMPTFENGDRVIVNKQSEIERFDVIVFKVDKDVNYIKRVIGLPGDHIAYHNDTLYINDVAYEEPYLQQYSNFNVAHTENFTLEQYTGYSEVPDGLLFVLGDNRENSSDSRDPAVGLVPMSSVIGEANVIFYPFVNVGMVQ